MNRRRRLFFLCINIINWQPKPHVAHDAVGEPLSWWFYKRTSGTKSLFEQNKLGNWWRMFWWKMARKCQPRRK